MTEQEKIEIESAIHARLSIIGSEKQSEASGTPHNSAPYWEKTVEWAFAQKYFKPNLFLAPLSSTAEAAGDAMVSFFPEDRWLLIEFKRTKADFTAEQNKYPVFEKVKKWENAPEEKIQEANEAFAELIEVWRLMKRLDLLPPHILVYGLLVPDTSHKPQKTTTALGTERPSPYGSHTLDLAAKS